MRVRVYDKQTKTYFKSEVYAVINSGYYEKHLVIAPTARGKCFRFFDYLDKSNSNLPVLINTIIAQRPSGWIYKKASSVDTILESYEEKLNENVHFFEFCGFPWIWEDIETLAHLLNGESILVQDTRFKENLYSDISQNRWNYIETQEDANSFMNEVAGFHDAVITELNYISGAYVDLDKTMQPVDDKRSVHIKIQSQQCKNFDMVFEGVTALNLRPAGDNYLGVIFEGALIVKNQVVVFCDDFIEEIDEAYQGTWISAYSLRWEYTE